MYNCWLEEGRVTTNQVNHLVENYKFKERRKQKDQQLDSVKAKPVTICL